MIAATMVVAIPAMTAGALLVIFICVDASIVPPIIVIGVVSEISTLAVATDTFSHRHCLYELPRHYIHRRVPLVALLLGRSW